MAIAEPNCECLWGNVGSNGRIIMAGYGISMDYSKVSKMERLSSLKMIRYMKIIAIYPMFSLLKMRLL